MPPSKAFCRKKSSSFWSHVLGHEGPNSLLSELMKHSLVTNLVCGSEQRLDQSIDIFKISVSLTDKGEKEYERVIEMIYMMINKLSSI
jgi:insulysin